MGEERVQVMFKCRYKDNPSSEWETSYLNLNTCAIAEVLTGDDSAYFSDLEVKFGEDDWIPLPEACKQNILIPDNYNTYLAEPTNDEQRERGWI